MLDLGFFLKKTLTLTILVDPFLTAPLFVLATSQVDQAWDLVHIVVSPLVAALVTWVVLEVAARTGQLFSRDALELLERVAGFLLAAIAVEMMAAGLRALFPNLLA